MDWFNLATRELETFFDVDRAISEDDRKERGMTAIDAFDKLFEKLARELRLRDKWITPHCHIMPFSTGIIQRSDRTRIEITLGVSLYGWFIRSPIAWPEQIRYMKDDYWNYIAQLSTIGEAEFHDYGRPGGWNDQPAAKKLLQHKLSLVFSIARDFTLLATNFEDDVCSLGGIHVTLPVESEEITVAAFFKQGLEALYRSNYLLFRSAYLQRQRVIKKFQQQRES